MPHSFHILSSISFPIILLIYQSPSLLSTASIPSSLLLLFLHIPSYLIHSSLSKYRCFFYTSSLLIFLLSPTFLIISLLLLLSTPSHFSHFLPALTSSILLYISYSFSLIHLYIFSLSSYPQTYTLLITPLYIYSVSYYLQMIILYTFLSSLCISSLKSSLSYLQAIITVPKLLSLLSHTFIFLPFSSSFIYTFLILSSFPHQSLLLFLTLTFCPSFYFSKLYPSFPLHFSTVFHLLLSRTPCMQSLPS